MSSVEHVKRARNIQKILELCESKKYFLAQAMSWYSLFEMHQFVKALIFIDDCMQTKLMSTTCSHNFGTQFPFVVQLM